MIETLSGFEGNVENLHSQQLRVPFLTLRRFAGGSEPSTTRSDIGCQTFRVRPRCGRTGTNGWACAAARRDGVKRANGSFVDLRGSTPARCDAERRGRKLQPLNKKLESCLWTVCFVSCTPRSHAAVEPVAEYGRLLSQTPMLRHPELVAQSGLLTSPALSPYW